ncbi:MAG: MMPL family transporter [Nanoarchaeota archaeon]|nr:MMPL family transporter [Nanoarchaeota archaeon]
MKKNKVQDSPVEKAFENEKLNNAFNWYYSKLYILLLIPLGLFLLSIFSIMQAIDVDGTPIYRDISLKGGLSLTLSNEEFLEYSATELQIMLQENFIEDSFAVREFQMQGQKAGFIINTNIEEEDLIAYLNNLQGVDLQIPQDFTSSFIAPSLSQAFFTQAMSVLLVSFVLISIIVFAVFRKFVPSIAIVISIIFDLVVTVGILNLLGVEVSIAGIGALLMLIGYSIDTDILLTNRVLREQKSRRVSFAHHFQEKFQDSFKTGMLMAGTTLSAAIAAIIITNSEVIFQITLILIIGLIVDAISTWIQNAAMLKWWMQNKDK